MNFNQKIHKHIQLVETKFLVSQINQRYRFPRGRDNYAYSPEHSFDSLRGETYNLKSQNIAHRRVKSIITDQIKQTLQNFSPYKAESLNQRRKLANLKQTPPKIMMMTLSKNKTLKKMVPKHIAYKIGSQASLKSTIFLHGKRLDTEPHEQSRLRVSTQEF
ncbi:hypothetical protein pb186bvf_014101 [Paramecium bursaria]